MPRRYKAVPQQIKADAVREAWQALRNAKLKAKQTGEKQEVSFQHRHLQQQSMFIPASAIKAEGVYVTLLGDLHLTEPLPARVEGVLGNQRIHRGTRRSVTRVNRNRLMRFVIHACPTNVVNGFFVLHIMHHKNRLHTLHESSHSTRVSEPF